MHWVEEGVSTAALITGFERSADRIELAYRRHDLRRDPDVKAWARSRAQHSDPQAQEGCGRRGEGAEERRIRLAAHRIRAFGAKG